MRKRSQASTGGAPKELPGDKLLRAIFGDAAANNPAPRATTEAVDLLAAGAYSEAEIFELVVPKRTLARRQARKEPLTVEETDKALRLARTADLARQVFGDDAKAHRWLRKPKRELNGSTPLAFLASEAGGRTVEQLLHRIDHGMFA
ncbi:MAG: antitoxin Xre/MbcA/ParS toxin-binding domain-containing protein [Acetobacterales bacterium]